jgi:hypothetical protein
MMMRTRFLAASVLIGALVGVTDAPAAGARSACAELGGNIQSGNVCRVYLDTPNYTIDVRFGTDYPDDQAVTVFLTQQRDRVISAAQAPGASDLPYEMNVSSESFSSGQRFGTTQAELGYGQPPHGTETLVVKLDDAMKGAPVGFRYKTFNYDLNQNRPVTFANLFAPGTNPIDTLYPIVATDLERQLLYRNFKLAPAVGHDPSHYQNFAITDDAVIFFFNAGELVTQESGDLRTAVPRASLPPLQL